MDAQRIFKIIAGIDQSLNSTGVAIIDADTGDLIVSKAIRLNKTKDTPQLKGPERLIYIRDTIRRMLEEHRVDFVAIEGYSFGSKGASIFDLGEIGGAVKVLVHDMQIAWDSVPPKTLKKYTTGNGNASKEEMAHAIHEKFKLHFGTEDEADAFALANMAMEIGPTNLRSFCYKEKKPKKKGKKSAEE